MIVVLFLFELSGHHRDLLVLSHSCPTRRASDLGDNISSLYQVYSLRSVEIVSLAQKSRTDDLQRLISSEAQFDIGSGDVGRSEEHTSELQSPMRNSYAVLCLKIKQIYTSVL